MNPIRVRIGVVGFLALVIVGLSVAFEFRRDILEQHARISIGSRLVSTPCGTIEVVEAGSGPALLVVHGAGGGFDQAVTLAADYAERGWKVIARSRFGYLRTPLPADASSQAQADHLACLLDALGVGEAAVMGISAGALPATQFAIRYPQRAQALILIVPAGHRPEPSREMSRFDEWLFNTTLGSDFPLWLMLRFLPDTSIRFIMGTPAAEYAAASPEDKRGGDRARAEVLPVLRRQQGMLNDIKLSTNTPRYDLEAICAPTLIISAKDDGWGSWPGTRYAAEYIRRGLPLSVSTHAANHHEVTLVQLSFDFYMIEAKPEHLIGDRAYDSDKLDSDLSKQGVQMIAPNRSSRKMKTQDGRALRRYARCWIVERFFAWLQWQRRLLVRWEYYARNFLGFFQLASISVLLKRF